MWERGRGRSSRVQKGREGRGVRVVGMGGCQGSGKREGESRKKKDEGDIKEKSNWEGGVGMG